jgi:hypothetical protein
MMKYICLRLHVTNVSTACLSWAGLNARHPPATAGGTDLTLCAAVVALNRKPL